MISLIILRNAEFAPMGGCCAKALGFILDSNVSMYVSLFCFSTLGVVNCLEIGLCIIDLGLFIFAQSYLLLSGWNVLVRLSPLAHRNGSHSLEIESQSIVVLILVKILLECSFHSLLLFVLLLVPPVFFQLLEFRLALWVLF